MIQLEVVRKKFWFLGPEKRYYKGVAQNLHKKKKEFLIDADWFDELPKGHQQAVYRQKYAEAYKDSLPKEVLNGKI